MIDQNNINTAVWFSVAVVQALYIVYLLGRVKYHKTFHNYYRKSSDNWEETAELEQAYSKRLYEKLLELLGLQDESSNGTDKSIQ